jgi:FkbM family methyltransferase
MKITERDQLKYYSQSRQDEILDTEIFLGKEGGFFVDIGAYDGVTFSNSYFFEKHRHWQGICVEPIPDMYAKLAQNRSCICVHGCISDTENEASFTEVRGLPQMLSGLTHFFDQKHKDRIAREIRERGGEVQTIHVPCYTLQNLLERHAVTKIDYLSLDTEGSEYAIVQTIDFSKVEIDYLTIENNNQDRRIRTYLKAHGYQLVRKDCDDLFVRADLCKSRFSYPGLSGWLKKVSK